MSKLFNRIMSLAAVIGLGTTLLASTCMAQEDPAADDPEAAESNDFTEHQAYLNLIAAQATSAQNFPRAEILFRATLELGEFNVTWLNLGRTYAKQGKCLEARDAYAHVNSSRKINPDYMDPNIITSSLAKFQTDLEEECNAVAVVACDPAEMVVTVDNGYQHACDGEPLFLKPGQHVFDGRAEDGSGVKVLQDIEAGLYNNVELKIVEKIIEIDNWEEDSKIYTAVGASMLAGGVIMAGVTSGFWVHQYNDYNAHQACIRGEYSADYPEGSCDPSEGPAKMAEFNNHVKMYGTFVGVGVAMALAGAGLLIADHVKFGEKKKAAKLAAEEEKSTSFEWSPVFTVSPEFSGLGFHAKF